MPTTEKKWSSSIDSDLNERDAKLLESREGLAVEADEILKTKKGEFFFKSGKQVVVFINDHTHSSVSDVKNNPIENNRFHIIACTTILKQVENNRFKKRYQWTSNKSGLFKLYAGVKRWFTKKTVTIEDGKLLICKNCLKELQDNYIEIAQRIGFDQSRIGFFPFKKMRADLWGNFSLEELFKSNKNYFIHQKPDYSDRNAPIPVYSDNFEVIKRKLKIRKNYTCEECGLDCSSIANHSLIDCNHKDGAKHNNAINNLEILCVECHTKRPNHGHYISIAKHRVQQCIQLKELQNIKQ